MKYFELRIVTTTIVYKIHYFVGFSFESFSLVVLLMFIMNLTKFKATPTFCYIPIQYGLFFTLQ